MINCAYGAELERRLGTTLARGGGRNRGEMYQNKYYPIKLKTNGVQLKIEKSAVMI